MYEINDKFWVIEIWVNAIPFSAVFCYNFLIYKNKNNNRNPVRTYYSSWSWVTYDLNCSNSSLVLIFGIRKLKVWTLFLQAHHQSVNAHIFKYLMEYGLGKIIIYAYHLIIWMENIDRLFKEALNQHVNGKWNIAISYRPIVKCFLAGCNNISGSQFLFFVYF